MRNEKLFVEHVVQYQALCNMLNITCSFEPYPLNWRFICSILWENHVFVDRLDRKAHLQACQFDLLAEVQTPQQ